MKMLRSGCRRGQRIEGILLPGGRKVRGALIFGKGGQVVEEAPREKLPRRRMKTEAGPARRKSLIGIPFLKGRPSEEVFWD